MELTVLCVSFTLLLLIGVPVAFAIGLSSIATIVVAGLPVAVVFQKMVGGMQIFSFLAIPFFIFAGELMLYGGIADRIVQFAKALVGHIRGGLGMCNVVACTLFGGVSGSPVADVSAMGSVMIPLMKREGYHADYAVNVTTHAALVGALMPTSHNLIIYVLATAGIAAVSVFNLILAALLPAVLLTLANLVAAYGVAVKRGYPTHGAFPGWGAVFAAFVEALWGLIALAIILGGILGGVFTAIEAGAVACVWAFFVTMFIYRDYKWRDLPLLVGRVVRTVGMVMIMIGFSIAFGYMMAIMRVPAMATQFFVDISSDKYTFLLWVNVLLLLLGTFMDMAPMILICTPIMLPVVKALGVDPVHFGMIMLLNLGIGLITPPFGVNIFVGQVVFKAPVSSIYPGLVPFIVAAIGALMIITYVPWLSLWILQYLG